MSCTRDQCLVLMIHWPGPPHPGPSKKQRNARRHRTVEMLGFPGPTSMAAQGEYNRLKSPQARAWNFGAFQFNNVEIQTLQYGGLGQHFANTTRLQHPRHQLGPNLRGGWALRKTWKFYLCENHAEQGGKCQCPTIMHMYSCTLVAVISFCK